MEERETETIRAVVTRVCPCHLMVRDCETQQEVRVHTDRACCFRRCECVCIVFSGAMTMSLPPQITALRISRIACPC